MVLYSSVYLTFSIAFSFNAVNTIYLCCIQNIQKSFVFWVGCIIHRKENASESEGRKNYKLINNFVFRSSSLWEIVSESIYCSIHLFISDLGYIPKNSTHLPTYLALSCTYVCNVVYVSHILKFCKVSVAYAFTDYCYLRVSLKIHECRKFVK